MKISQILPFDCLLTLTSCGFSLNAELDDFNEEGFTPLMALSYSGKTEGVRILLEKGADPNLLIPEGTKQHKELNALILAAQYDQVECLKLLIEYKGDPCSKLTHGSPLQIAAQAGKINCLRFLLELKINPNFQAKEEEVSPPIQLAARHGRREALKLLLQAKADPNSIYNGCSTLMAACGHEEQNIHESSQIISERIKMIEILVAAGAFVNYHAPNASGGIGRTALLQACARNPKLIKTLLYAGANPNVVDRQGLSPLAVSVVKGNYTKTRLLLKYNAKLFFQYQHNDIQLSLLRLGIDKNNRCIEPLTNEYIFALTIKYKILQKTVTDPKAALKGFMQEKLGTQNQDAEARGQMVRKFIYGSVVNLQIPNDLFLTAYKIKLLAKHTFSKGSIPDNLVSHIMNFTTTALSPKRQANITRLLHPEAIKKAQMALEKLEKQKQEKIEKNVNETETVEADDGICDAEFSPSQYLVSSKLNMSASMKASNSRKRKRV